MQLVRRFLLVTTIAGALAACGAADGRTEVTVYRSPT